MKFAFVILFAVMLTTVLSAAEPVFLQNGVTAHRGNSGEYPENTIPAFQSGIDVGADWLELDIFQTKDGQLVVTHDKTTERVGDKNLDVASSTYAELKTVDVATDFRKRHQLSKAACPPQRMPLLEEVLLLVKQQNKTRVSIQPKADCVKAAVALVKRLEMESWVGFNDGNLNYMTQVKQLAPELPVFWDRGADTDLDADIRIAKQRGFEALVLQFKGITPDKVRKIKAADLEPGAWTVNDPALMQQLLQQGVERIYTDEPAQLLRLK
ncbi:glycerophosphodiester phosphodiesterase [Gimesia sp.]|uniref:glycerophosphodiester phosphodiesterase n=1 Tax=Gimesia sp. TaxID=2024833 RepID=UPI003A8EFEE4